MESVKRTLFISLPLLLIGLLGAGCDALIPEASDSADSVVDATTLDGDGMVSEGGTTAEAVALAAPAELPAGIAGTREVWSYASDTAFTGLAASAGRVVVMLADGRLMWLNASKGSAESGTFIWPGMLGGVTEGEMVTDGMAVAVAAIERLIPDREDRARFAVYDSDAKELWSLPTVSQGRRYTCELAGTQVIVGGWPGGYYENALTAYDLISGEEIWSFAEELAGFKDIAISDDLVLALMEKEDESAVIALNVITGEVVWRWEGDGEPPTRITAGEGRVYLLRSSGIVALSLVTGTVNWRVGFDADAEAPLLVGAGHLFTTPTPTEALSYRPGVVGLHAASGELAWHSGTGFLVDALAMDENALWIVRKDIDSGSVWLEAIDPITGETLVSLPISQQPDLDYALAVSDQRILVIGDAAHMLAYQE